MKYSRLFAPAVLLLLAALTAGIAVAADAVKSKEYSELDPPQPVSSGAKVEVLEFFFYGCPHCYSLQPALKTWARTMPKDVEFKRVPAVFRDSWVPLARAYYALEATGALEKVHHDVFTAIHEEKREIMEKQGFLDWAAKKGIDRKKLEDAFDSFAVQTKTQRAIQMTKLYGISGTPSVVVDGKYLTAPGNTMTAQNTVDYDRFIKLIDELIVAARKTHGGKKG